MRRMKGAWKLLLVFCLLLNMSLQPMTVYAKSKTLPISPTESDYYFKKGYSAKQIAGRKKVVKIAKKYLGIREKSSKHKKIIKNYNSIKNNMFRRNRYTHLKATTSMPWCDIFVSAVFNMAGLSNASKVECGCEEHIDLLRRYNCWVEKDSYVPSTGDLIFYSWGDSGKGENRRTAEHVGIVVGVKNKVITTIEGNYDDTVKYRAIKVNGRYIRGFGVPKY